MINVFKQFLGHKSIEEFFVDAFFGGFFRPLSKGGKKHLFVFWIQKKLIKQHSFLDNH